jgi:hypothetical protein
MGNATRAGRVARGIAAAGLALVLAGGAIAGPASAAQLDSFAGTGTGYALRVTLDVRPLLTAVPALKPVLDQVWASVPGQSGAFPGVIDQTFIKTTSDADGTIHKARSVLAEGLIDLDSLEASNVGDAVEKVVQTVSVPSTDLPLIDAAVGTLKAAVSKGPAVNASGVLARLGVDLPVDALPANVATDLVAQLTSTVSDLTDDLTANLTSALGTSGVSADLVDQLTGTIGDLTGTGSASQLGGLTSGLGLGDVGQLDDPAAVTPALTNLLDVDSLVTQITDLLNNSLLEGALADLTSLVNITKAARTNDGVAMADSLSTLKSLDVLGGLVHVGVLNLKSHSEAAGIAGSASNSSDCSIADVKVGGDALALSLDGKNVFVNGTPVPVVGDLVGQVKGVVDEVLKTVGIELGLCDTAQADVEADGTAAAQRVSALRVKVAPLGLFSLVIDPTVETQAAAQVAVPVDSNPGLPRTGPAAIATILSGIGLAGGALFARKRFL